MKAIMKDKEVYLFVDENRIPEEIFQDVAKGILQLKEAEICPICKKGWVVKNDI